MIEIEDLGINIIEQENTADVSFTDDPKENNNGCYDIDDNHLAIFGDEIIRRMSYFGLVGWEIEILKYPGLKSDAECTFNIYARDVTFKLSDEVSRKPIEENLRFMAFHEVCHIFFARLEFIAGNRDFRDNDIVEEIHHLIRVLENKIFWKEQYAD